MSENAKKLLTMLREKKLVSPTVPDEAMTVEVLGDKTALSFKEAANCELDILQERVRTLSAQVDEGFRKEVELKDKLRNAEAELSKTRRENYISENAQILRLNSICWDIFGSLEREPTTSPFDAKLEFEKLAEEWLAEVTGAKGYIETAYREELARRISQITAIKKQSEAIAKLTQIESIDWHQADVYRRWFESLIHDTLLAVQATERAIRMVQACLRAGAEPMLVGLAYESAKSAKDVFDSLYSSLSTDIVYDLNRSVDCAEGYVRSNRAAETLKA